MSVSLQRVLDRAILRSVVVTAGAVLVMGLVASFIAALSQDDADASATAHNLAQELDEGGHATAHEVFAKERSEVVLGARTAEAWDGTVALSTSPGTDAAKDGCTFAGSLRRCRETVGTYHVVVATPIGVVVGHAAPVAGSVLLTALFCAVLLFIAGRRSARTAVTPLLRLEATLRDAKSLPRSDHVATEWGLAEVDSLASALRAALARAEVATARESRFVADAAHELRTPLTRLQGQLELTLPTVTGEARERTSRALANVRDLVRLTEALLAMARGELPEREPVDLSDVVEAVTRALDERDRARVTTSLAPDVIASADPALLERAVGNLVGNALLHGKGQVRIVLTANDEAVLDVLDEGEGIAEGERERLKTAFVRGTTKAHGSGIGLALVDHVATLHSGALELSNRTEGGLRARLRFPRWRAEAGAAKGR